MAPARLAVRLVAQALAQLAALAVVAAQCPGSMYSYGSGACASCAAGASFISSSAGCAPSATLTSGPADTTLYLSGSEAEGVAAFAATGAAPTYAAGVFGAAGGALVLASGSYLTVPGASAPAALPSSGSVAWSASAWVKCAAPTTWAAVLEWGAAGDAQGAASAQTAALVVAGPEVAAGGMVTTLAGSGNREFADGTGAAASFNQLHGVAVIPSSGLIVVADTQNHRIRLVTPLGDVTTLAGSGTCRSVDAGGNCQGTFADGVGTAASFNNPQGVAVFPSSGLIVVADYSNSRIRLVDPNSGTVSTIAGGGVCCQLVDGAGTAATFSGPVGVAVIPSSGLIVVVEVNHRGIRLVDSTSGIVTTLVGSDGGYADGAATTNAIFSMPWGVAVVPSTGVIIVADNGNHLIRLVNPTSGAVTTLAGSGRGAFADGTGTAASFWTPQGVAVIPSSGLIVVADTGNRCIRLVDPTSGAVSTLAGSGAYAFADGMGKAASFRSPTGVAVSPSSGLIVVVDQGNQRIRLVTSPLSPALAACDSTWHHVALVYSPSASPYKLSAFLDGALTFQLAAAITLPVRAASTLRIGWNGNATINSGSLFAGSLAEMRVYARSLTTTEVTALFSTYSYGSGVSASCAAGANFVSSSAGCTPSATLTAGPADTALYLSGSQAEGVAAFAATGAAPTYAAGPFGTAGGALVLTGGIYLDAAGASAPEALPNGGDVTWSASAWVKCAALAGPWAGVLEWGATGNAQGVASAQTAALVVAGPAAAAAGWGTGGVVTTLAGSGNAAFADGTGTAASFNQPYGVAVIPSSGLIVMAEWSNHRIRLVDTTTGAVTTLAGSGSAAFADGSGTAASFKQPSGVALIPSSGLIVVGDFGNHRIRLVNLTSGAVTTLAGSGSAAFADGTGTAASFNFPLGVAVIPSSSLIVVADNSNHRVRLVNPTSGVVTTLAGSGVAAFADGTGAGASFNYPAAVTVIPSSGLIVVSESYNHCIRLVAPATGTVTTLAGSGTAAFADGTGAAAKFNFPSGVAVIPSSGLVVVGDYDNNRIRLVDPNTGVVTTLAGSGSTAFADGTGAAASFSRPWGVAVIPSSGVIVVTDHWNHRLRLVTSPHPPALAACDSTWRHVALAYSPSASPHQLSAFLDGALAFQLAAAITLPARAASTLRVGWSGDLSSNAGSLFTGSLAELRIYNRSLSSAEVVALSQPPLAAFAYTAVVPAAPSAGATSYAFSCAAPAAGNGGIFTKSGVEGSWAWAGGIKPSCAVSPTPSSTPSASSTPTPTQSKTPSSTLSLSPSPTPTPTQTQTQTGSQTPTHTDTPTSSTTASLSATPSQSPSQTGTATPFNLVSLSATTSLSATPTPSRTPTVSLSASPLPLPAAGSVIFGVIVPGGSPLLFVRNPSLGVQLRAACASLLAVTNATSAFSVVGLMSDPAGDFIGGNSAMNARVRRRGLQVGSSVVVTLSVDTTNAAVASVFGASPSNVAAALRLAFADARLVSGTLAAFAAAWASASGSGAADILAGLALGSVRLPSVLSAPVPAVTTDASSSSAGVGGGVAAAVLVVSAAAFALWWRRRQALSPPLSKVPAEAHGDPVVATNPAHAKISQDVASSEYPSVALSPSSSPPPRPAGLEIRVPASVRYAIPSAAPPTQAAPFDLHGRAGRLGDVATGRSPRFIVPPMPASNHERALGRTTDPPRS
jgi:hypothetical protein